MYFSLRVDKFIHNIGGFHVTSLPPCWWTKTKDLSLASLVRPPEGKSMFLKIFDTSGQFDTASSLPQYHHGAVVVFDVIS